MEIEKIDPTVGSVAERIKLRILKAALMPLEVTARQCEQSGRRPNWGNGLDAPNRANAF